MLVAIPAPEAAAGESAQAKIAVGSLDTLHGATAASNARDVPTPPLVHLQGRVLATGIVGLGGIRQVGYFHAGGPIPSNPEFALQTRHGRVLDPTRLLAASRFNYGARPVQGVLPGAVLSLDTNAAAPIAVPPDFAARDTSAVGGAVLLFSVASADRLNGYYNRGAITHGLPAVSNPRYISVNNAFGRPWAASSPVGLRGPAMSSVLDPDGRPLNNAPSRASGGVFAGAQSDRTRGAYEHDALGRTLLGDLYREFDTASGAQRSGQYLPGGLTRGGVGTAFLGASPDATGFAVFAIVMNDGSVAQVHVRDGVDGLLPPGTVHALARDDDLIGMAFKWTPDRALFIADSAANRIAVADLTSDSARFISGGVRYLRAPEFDQPVDLAPAVPEIANPKFSSHSTLAAGADLYVANRGSGALLRVRDDGRVLARADVTVPEFGHLGAGALRSIAVSGDAQRIWLGVCPDQPCARGAIVEVSAFDARGSYAEHGRADNELAEQGRAFFTRQSTAAEGLGPLFNARACAQCHQEPTLGGYGAEEAQFAHRVAKLDPVTGRTLAASGPNFPVAHMHSLDPARFPPGVPRDANAVSLRMPPALYEVGQIDDVPDDAILLNAVGKGDGIHGRPNIVFTRDGPRIGRFGWKADKPTLEDMVGSAMNNELGITNPRAGDRSAPPKDDGSMLKAIVAFLRTLITPDIAHGEGARVYATAP